MTDSRGDKLFDVQRDSSHFRLYLLNLKLTFGNKTADLPSKRLLFVGKELYVNM